MNGEPIDRAALHAHVLRTEANFEASLRRLEAAQGSRNPLRKLAGRYAVWADRGSAEDAFAAFENAYNTPTE